MILRSIPRWPYNCTWIIIKVTLLDISSDCQGRLTNLEQAHKQIDIAIATMLRESKPMYLSISCSFFELEIAGVGDCPPEFVFRRRRHMPISVERQISIWRSPSINDRLDSN